MFSTIIMSLPALLNVGCLWSLTLFIYAVLGVNFFFDNCTVPPPAATAVNQDDPCLDTDKLGYTGFVAMNATEAIAAYDSGNYGDDDPIWQSLCVPSILECGDDFHYVWQCEDTGWAGEPVCEGDGGGNSYHECACENTAADGNFYSFGDAFLTLIRFSTGEFWNGLMHDAYDQ